MTNSPAKTRDIAAPNASSRDGRRWRLRATAPTSVGAAQSRHRKKALKGAIRDHDPDAARLLLSHSVAVGHGRLGLRRYLAARYLGAAGLEVFRPFCVDAARRIDPCSLLNAAITIAKDLHVDVDVHAALSELKIPAVPLVLPYAATTPKFGSAPQYCGLQVSLLGRLEIGKDGWFGPGCVVRGDGHFVVIGDHFRIGERGTVHISHELYPVIVGDRVTAGKNSVIHACTVGDDCVIEDGVVILDGAVLEAGIVIEANSTVFPRTNLASGWLYAGSPAKPVRELEAGELERRREAVSAAIFASLGDSDLPISREAELGDDVFIAENTVLQGAIKVGDRSGIFFGCQLIGSGAGIEIGPDCNVQDNTFISAAKGPVSVGAETTIGHNVDLGSCRIGSRSLIGIGSELGEGTIVDDDVMLAGGSTTLPGQHLESGWLWAGRPARPIATLDDTKRAMMSATITHYRTYGEEYAAAQIVNAMGGTGANQ